MADDLPRTGLVSMLASKFGELKSSKESLNEPSAPSSKPTVSNPPPPSSQDPLQQAIFFVVEQTKPLKAEELVNLVPLSVYHILCLILIQG